MGSFSSQIVNVIRCYNFHEPNRLKKINDVVFLEPDQSERDLMFGKVAVPGKNILMLEDNTCVCDMDCNCNCNCNCE